MHVIMILTSHAKLGSTDKKTGFWLEEFSAPSHVLLDAGEKITLASALVRKPALDPQRDVPDAHVEDTGRLKQNT